MKTILLKHFDTEYQHVIFEQKDLISISNPQMNAYVKYKGRKDYHEIIKEYTDYTRDTRRLLTRYIVRLFLEELSRAMMDDNEIWHMPAGTRLGFSEVKAYESSSVALGGRRYSCTIIFNPRRLSKRIPIFSVILRGRTSRKFLELLYEKGKKYSAWALTTVNT